MLIQRFIPGFRALVFQMGIFSHFALALAGAAGLGLGLAENASAEGLAARTGFAPRQLCTINEENFEGKYCCSKFGGALQPTPDPRYWACSEIDINDTFCFTGVKTAFPCAGLYQHVQSCNQNHNRPALDPFYCAQRCRLGYKAQGARCVEDRAFSDNGGVYDPSPIPWVASYVGELFRLTATVGNGSAVFVLPDAVPPLSLSVVVPGKVAAVHVPRGSDLQGTRRARSEHLVTVQTQFVFRVGDDGKATRPARTTLDAYTVTALAKRKPLVIFLNAADGIKAALPEYGYPNIFYALEAANPRITGLTGRKIDYQGAPPSGGTLAVTLLATVPGAFLGALRLTATLVFNCEAAGPGGVPLPQAPSNLESLNQKLEEAVALGDDDEFCRLLRQGATPADWVAAYHQAFRPRPLPPGAARIIGRMLEEIPKRKVVQPLCPSQPWEISPCDRPLQVLAEHDSLFLPLVRRLVEEVGASMDSLDYKGRTALMPAAGSAAADERMFDYVLANTADRNINLQQIGLSIFIAAILEEREPACPDKGGEDVCSKNTALHYAAEAGNAYRIGELLKRGAEVDAENLSERTPVYLAVEAAAAEAIRALVEADATLDELDINGKAPIHYAAEKSNVEVVCALLPVDASETERERLAGLPASDGRTPFKIAQERGNHEVASTLERPALCLERS